MAAALKEALKKLAGGAAGGAPGGGAAGGLLVAGIGGIGAIYGLSQSFYTVDGGHRAIIFSRIGGIQVGNIFEVAEKDKTDPTSI